MPISKYIDEPSDGGTSLWVYVGAGTGVVVVVGLGVWYWRRRKAAAAVGAGPAAPDGYELVECETYRERTLCVIKDKGAGIAGYMGRFHWRVGDGTPSETGFAAPGLAKGAGKKYVDTLEDAPLPTVEPAEPEAGAEPPGPQTDLNTGTAAHGVTVGTVGGVCQAITLNSLADWLPYATELLEGLNLQAWSSAELMDRVWLETFPACGEHMSELGGVTVGGQPYADVVAAGQAFLDQEIHLLGVPNTMESVFAGFMVGEPYVAPVVEPVVQIALGPDSPELLHYPKPGTDDLYWIVTTRKPVLLPGKDPTVESTWRVWGPNTNIVGEPVAQGDTGGRAQSLNEAKSWIDGVGA